MAPYQPIQAFNFSPYINSMGTQAKSPQDNQTAPNNGITSSQAKPFSFDTKASDAAFNGLLSKFAPQNNTQAKKQIPYTTMANGTSLTQDQSAKATEPWQTTLNTVMGGTSKTDQSNTVPTNVTPVPPPVDHTGQVYNSMTGTWSTPQTTPVNSNSGSTGTIGGANALTPANVYPTATTGLVGAGANANAIGTQYANMINPIVRGAIGQETGDLTTGTAPIGEGNAAVAASAAGNLISGLTAQEQQQLSGNSQNITALNNAGTLTAPQLGQYGQAYYQPSQAGTNNGGQGGVSPTDPFYSTLQQYAQLAATGQISQVPSSITGNAVLNAQMNQMAQQISPNYTPLSSGVIGSSNASQAVNYGKQAADLSGSLQNLTQDSTLATNFLQGSNLLNPTTNPHVNAGINTYIGMLNPSDQKSYTAIIGDVQKFTSQILASNNGQIPTAITNTLQSFDPSTLSAPELVPYLQTLSQLGNIQLGVLQGQANSALSSGGNLYTGGAATPSTIPSYGPNAGSGALTFTGGANADQFGEAATGGAINAFGGIEGIFTSIIGKL